MTVRVASPYDILRGPIVTKDGHPTPTFLRQQYDLWLRSGGAAGGPGFNLLSGSTFTQFFEDQQGNTYLTNNAIYNTAEGYWERIAEDRSAWMMVMLGVSEPLEEALGLPAQTAGWWIAQPSKIGGVNNPAFTPETPTRRIKDGFTGAAGGWERGVSVTQFGDWVIRGYGTEIDANGIVPFSRDVGGFAPGAGTYGWFGRIYNVYLDHSGTDRAAKASMAQVLRSTAATGAPYDWILTSADATNPGAGASDVGTTAPDFDEVWLRAARVEGSVNWITVKPSVTSEPALIEAEGSDTNIGVKIAPKGTGSVLAKGGGTGMTVLIEDGTTTAGNVGVKAIGNNAYLRAGNNDVVEVDFAGNTRLGVGAITTDATNGFAYIPTCPGTPTGTPAAKTGLVPLVFDSTNDILYAYDGAWIGAALT